MANLSQKRAMEEIDSEIQLRREIQIKKQMQKISNRTLSAIDKKMMTDEKFERTGNYAGKACFTNYVKRGLFENWTVAL